jgi:hypothetical protein
MLLPAADPGPQPRYVSGTSGLTYVLNTQRMDFAAAEQYCNDQGGHLASWGSSAEQTEVEQWFTAQGFLFPDCHLSYWIGLKTDQWPNFYWTDRWGCGSVVGLPVLAFTGSVCWGSLLHSPSPGFS